MGQGTGSTQGETIGPDQEPTQAGDQDPAVRDPRPDGPMNQPIDQDRASDEFGEDTCLLRSSDFG